MNGYSIMAENYRKQSNEKKARIYDFLASCDTDDINTLFDSTAFNEIAKDYLKLVVNNLITEGIINNEQGSAVKNEYSMIFDEASAEEVRNR